VSIKDLNSEPGEVRDSAKDQRAGLIAEAAMSLPGYRNRTQLHAIGYYNADNSLTWENKEQYAHNQGT
jgi:hypothetical protein